MSKVKVQPAEQPVKTWRDPCTAKVHELLARKGFFTEANLSKLEKLGWKPSKE